MGRVMQECKIAIDPDEFSESFNPDLIEVRDYHRLAKPH